MQAERRSLSKETPQNFQYLTEVVENYFYNVLLSFTQILLIIRQLFRDSLETDYQQTKSSEK